MSEDNVAVTPAAPTENVEVVETLSKPVSFKDAEEPEVAEEKEPVSEEQEAPKEDPRIASKFNVLARRERELRKREESLKELETKTRSYEEALKNIKADPLRFLEEHVGLDFAGLTEFVLNGREETPDMKLKNLEKRIKEAEETRIREAEEARVAEERARLEAADRQINEFRETVFNVIESNPDDFELIRLKEAHNDVFETIEEVWKRTGEVLPPQKAAQLVEDFLLEEEKKLLTSSRKLGTAAQSQSASSRRKSETREASNGRNRMATTTLSHERLTGPTSNASERKPLSREESLARAAKLLKWTDD